MPRDIDIVQGTNVVAKNIVKFTQRFLEEVNKDMEQVSALLYRTIRKNISLTDHSLADLAALGHPYSRRAQGAPLHIPDYQVHRQSGRLLNSMISGVEAASVSGGNLKASAYAGVAGELDYAIMVVRGTSKMVPRNFLLGSLGEVKEQIKQLMSRSLHGAVVSFQGEKVKL